MKKPAPQNDVIRQAWREAWTYPPPAEPPTNLAKWLADPRTDEFLGRRACFKLEVLAQIISGEGTLSGIAKKYGTTKQAAGNHATKARRIFLPGSRKN